MTEVLERAENEPRSIGVLDRQSHLGRRHVCGQKGSVGSSKRATWTEGERDRHGVDVMFFVADVEIVYTLVCTQYGAMVFVTY
jgi:hypothetical protein